MMNTLTLSPSVTLPAAPIAVPWRALRHAVPGERTARPAATDAAPAPAIDAAFARDVLAGLAQRRKSIPCTWLDDAHGSEPFERITGPGVTAAFHENLLARINRELGGNFSLDAFEHEARWDAERRRIETHLVSVYTQRVTVLGRAFRFAMGESIRTGNSHECSAASFQALAARAGGAPLQRWTDAPARFAVHGLERL